MQITETQLDESSHSEHLSQDIGTIEISALLVRYLHLFWSERKLLARALVVGLLFGLVLAILLPKEYTSTVQLMPPDSQSNAGMLMTTLLSQSGGGAMGGLVGDLLGMKNSGALLVGVLHSRTVEDRLIQRFNLKSVYKDKLEEDARTDLSANTSIAEDRKTGIITLMVTDKDPNRVAQIAQAYVEELNHLLTQVSASSAHKERVFLEGRLQSVKQDLDKASQSFSQFSSKNGTLDIKEQGKTMVEAATTLQGELVAAEADLKELQQIYAPGNVRVKAVSAKVAELQQQLNKIGGTGSEDKSNLKTDYPSIRELPILGVTYSDLYRQLKIQEAVYETLTQEYEIAKVEEAKETPSVKVLDSAEVPERKSSPKRLQITFICMLLALLAVSLFLVIKSWWIQLNPIDPIKVLGQEIFQAISSKLPWLPSDRSRAQS